MARKRRGQSAAFMRSINPHLRRRHSRKHYNGGNQMARKKYRLKASWQMNKAVLFFVFLCPFVCLGSVQDQRLFQNGIQQVFRRGLADNLADGIRGDAQVQRDEFKCAPGFQSLLRPLRPASVRAGRSHAIL